MLGCICTVWFTKHGTHDPESDVDVFSITAEYFWKSVSFKGTQDGNSLTKQWYFCCHGRRTARDNNWQTDARVMCLRVPEGERETKNVVYRREIRGIEREGGGEGEGGRERERESSTCVSPFSRTVASLWSSIFFRLPASCFSNNLTRSLRLSITLSLSSRVRLIVCSCCLFAANWTPLASSWLRLLSSTYTYTHVCTCVSMCVNWGREKCMYTCDKR